MSVDEVAGAKKNMFGKMMVAIKSGHTWGNRVRMLKLPLIFTETWLYAGAIANFYYLTLALEEALDKARDDIMVSQVLAMGLRLVPGYEADLAQLYGKDWRTAAAAARTATTDAYCKTLESSSPMELVSASFILYGALVIGGGKATQKKVRGVFPGCDHVLFDVHDDMKQIRATFKKCFNEIGDAHPDQFDAMVMWSAKFMQLNNEVVLSIRCIPRWWWQPVLVGGVAYAAMQYMKLKAN